MARDKGARQVDQEVGVLDLARAFGQRQQLVQDSCIVDQDVEPAKPGHRVANELLHASVVGTVALVREQALLVLGFNSGRKRIEQRVLDIRRHDVGACGEERLYNGEAKPPLRRRSR